MVLKLYQATYFLMVNGPEIIPGMYFIMENCPDTIPDIYFIMLEQFQIICHASSRSWIMSPMCRNGLGVLITMNSQLAA